MAEPQLSFSLIEIGLLTEAERRGAVRTPRRIDERNDPASIERLAVLRRLTERGYLIEVVEERVEEEVFEFTITDAGRTALVAVDRKAPRG